VSEPSDRTAVAERKLVTALFCDLVGSTSLGERLDPEALGRVQAAYFDRLRSVVEGHGGTIEKFIGDAVVAIFGVPVAHEDDAERAVRCALAVGPAMAGLNDTLRARFGVELEVRIGIHTGEAIVTGRTADAIATGDVLNTAARLEAAAGPGEILVGRDTMVLAREAIEFEGPRSFEAKGKAEPVEAWQPTGPAADGARPRVTIVGRVGELEVLGAALERAIGEDAAQVVLVLGEPGIGKSRLVEEFASRVRGRAALIREVAYGSLPKHRRAEVHPRVAEWLSGFAQERPELWGAAAHHPERIPPVAQRSKSPEPRMKANETGQP
jgi:class 3 adenylate cyclase